MSAPYRTIQLQRDIAANWTSANTLLADWEVWLETDTRKAKIGNWVTNWNSLAYAFMGNGGDMLKADNLSGIADYSIARTNLGVPSGSGTSTWNNTGNQTSIVGITGTLANFNAAVIDADLARTDAANTFTWAQSIASIKGTLTADTDGTTITFNKNVSDFHSVTLGGNRALALSNMASGDRIVLRLEQDGTWTRTVTWFITIKWVWGTVPTLTTTINKADTFGFLCTSAGNYDGFIIWQNI